MAAAEDAAPIILDIATAATARYRVGPVRPAWRDVAGLVNGGLLVPLDDDELDELAAEVWAGGARDRPLIQVRKELVRTLDPGRDVSVVLLDALEAAGELPDRDGPTGRDAAARAVAAHTLRFTADLAGAPEAGRHRLVYLFQELADGSADPDTAELTHFAGDLLRPGREDRLVRPSDLPRLATAEFTGAVDLSRVPVGPGDLAAMPRMTAPGLVLPDFAHLVAPSLALRSVLAPLAAPPLPLLAYGAADEEVRVGSPLPQEDGPDPDRLNIALVRADRRDEPIRSGALAASTDHLVRVSIGPLEDDALPGTDDPLDLTGVPYGEELDVVLWADAALRVPGAATSGSLVTGPERPLLVGRPADPAATPARLWFRIRTPAEPGRHTVRVCVYHRNVLLQARQLTVPTGRQRARAHLLVSTYDAVSSAPAAVSAQLAPRRLSIHVNDSADGSHDLWLRGQDGTTRYEGGGHFDGAGVAALIGGIRGGLRKASWGRTDPWRRGEVYGYRTAGTGFGESHEKLRADLLELARRGYGAWETVTSRLGSPADQQDLQDLMRAPGGVVEVAPKLGSTVVPPAACLYDLDFDAEAEVAALRLCPVADQALRDRADLAATACFTAGCAHAGGTVVCPSGFWGLRHDITVPLSLGSAAGRTPRLPVGPGGPPAALIGTVPDKVVRGVRVHAQEVGTRFAAHDHVTGRTAWFARARQPGRYAVLYFLCHGEERDTGSVIVLDALGLPGIARSSLKSERVALEHHPLVVLNACETGALEPDKAISLVEGFAYRGAAGVIGTEITVFTSLAYAFATTFFDLFAAAAPRPLGSAVRATRLELLRRGNPLGLAYVAYGLADAALAP
jgi:hypothetical protein